MSPISLLTNLSFYFLLILTDGDSLRIVNLDVPSGVPNTTTSAILDCDYSLETGSDDGLVVKWFYDNQRNPVYQWIPGRKPQDAGVLKNRTDLNHEASSDPMKKFRAIKINSLTTELSGVYTCIVSTFDDEARESKKMTIYTPAKEVEFSQEEDTEKGEITLQCSAEGVYPKPEFNITTRERPNYFPVTINWTEREDRLYDVEASVSFLKKDLTSKTTFDCILSIPDTDYEENKSISIPTVRGTPNPRNFRTTQISPQENLVTAPEHYDPDIFFIRGESNASINLKATFISALLFNVFLILL